MTKQERVTLIGVIAKVKEIADRDYDNKIYENILAIFNKLNTQQKRILLKGLINICFVVEDKVLVSTADLLEVKDAVLETKGRIESSQSIEEGNKVELAKQLIKMKTLIIEAVILFLLTCLVIILVIARNNDVIISIISNISQLINFFLG